MFLCVIQVGKSALSMSARSTLRAGNVYHEEPEKERNRPGDKTWKREEYLGGPSRENKLRSLLPFLDDLQDQVRRILEIGGEIHKAISGQTEAGSSSREWLQSSGLV